MNRDETGRFTKQKKGKGIGDHALGAALGGAGGAAGAAAGHELGRVVMKTEAGRDVSKIAKNALETGTKKVSQLGRMLKGAGGNGIKGYAVKGGIAGLGAGALASLLSGDDDEDDEDNES